MALTDEQNIKFIKGGQDFNNAIVNFLLAHSSLLVYETNLNLDGISSHSDELRAQIKNIDKISSEISKISSNTQMLSINASIEAARAGEAGKGFAVVAHEVGKLSNNTKECTSRVEDVNKKTYAQAISTEQSIRSVQKELNVFGESNQTISQIISKRTKINEDGYIITLLAMRLQDHANFLTNLMKNASKQQNIVDHHNCALGKWYDSNKEKYRNIPEFNDLYGFHESFHSLAIQFNETMNPDALLGLANVSHQILTAFLALVDAFEERILKQPELYI